MLFGKLHNKLKSISLVSHIKSHFSMYFTRIYHLQRHEVPLLERNLRISENPYLQRKSKLRSGNCGKLQQFTQILHSPTTFHNINIMFEESTCQESDCLLMKRLHKS